MAKKLKVPEVLDQLQALGSSDAIAAHFEEHGVTGRRGSASRCPVAEHVRAETGSPWVSVNCKSVSVNRPSIWPWVTERDYAVTQPAVAEFVRRFDWKHYPQLVK
jgi:hypothetical protein